jgi:hypothetical protein
MALPGSNPPRAPLPPPRGRPPPHRPCSTWKIHLRVGVWARHHRHAGADGLPVVQAGGVGRRGHGQDHVREAPSHGRVRQEVRADDRRRGAGPCAPRLTVTLSHPNSQCRTTRHAPDSSPSPSKPASRHPRVWRGRLPRPICARPVPACAASIRLDPPAGGTQHAIATPLRCRGGRPKRRGPALAPEAKGWVPHCATIAATVLLPTSIGPTARFAATTTTRAGPAPRGRQHTAPRFLCGMQFAAGYEESCCVVASGVCANGRCLPLPGGDGGLNTAGLRWNAEGCWDAANGSFRVSMDSSHYHNALLERQCPPPRAR